MMAMRDRRRLVPLKQSRRIFWVGIHSAKGFSGLFHLAFANQKDWRFRHGDLTNESYCCETPLGNNQRLPRPIGIPLRTEVGKDGRDEGTDALSKVAEADGGRANSQWRDIGNIRCAEVLESSDGDKVDHLSGKEHFDRCRSELNTDRTNVDGCSSKNNWFEANDIGKV
ncbi:hypothetical protein HG531_008374 [Fusarium graminearum]|nr:hypothetical protein HG531_008374 [Fusarium graminearum]